MPPPHGAKCPTNTVCTLLSYIWGRVPSSPLGSCLEGQALTLGCCSRPSGN